MTYTHRPHRLFLLKHTLRSLKRNERAKVDLSESKETLCQMSKKILKQTCSRSMISDVRGSISRALTKTARAGSILQVNLPGRTCSELGHTAWCSETGSLTSPNAPELYASSDVRGHISLHQAVSGEHPIPWLLSMRTKILHKRKTVQCENH